MRPARVRSISRWLASSPAGASARAPSRAVLPGEVETLLDDAMGPAAYTRDDSLAAQVVEHYRFNLGRIVETAPSELLYKQPLHPYTEALLSAVPIPDPEVETKRERIVLTGDIPSPTETIVGCPFRPRCAQAFDRCAIEAPTLKEHAAGHAAACFLHDE